MNTKLKESERIHGINMVSPLWPNQHLW